jgi:rhamnulokinase
MPEKKFIGFDLGAESGRCVVALLKDQKVTLNEVHRFTTHSIRYEGGFHWDILSIYEEIIEGLKKAQKTFGKDFNGIGVDTWGVDYVLIDSQGRIAGYPYHYRDDRTDKMMDKAFKIIGKEYMYRKAGIQFAQYNTLFQLLAEKKRKQSFLDFSDKMLLMPDFINYMLSGQKKAEFSIASTTGLVDSTKREWSRQLIKKFGFPKKIFPEIVEPGTKLGTLLPSIAKATGLSPDIPVIAVAGHDTASAVASIPVSGANWAFLSSGTWSPMGIELNHPLLTKQAMKFNFTNEGGVEGTTRLLKNKTGLWPIQECRRNWFSKGKEFSYQELSCAAKDEGFVKSWVDLNNPMFLKAGDMPEKIIAFLNETNQVAKSTPGFITAVILESLAFSYRNVIKEIEEISGNKISRLHAVGGGIQNEQLTRLTADATECTVFAGPIEGTITGNIGVQAIAMGEVKNIKEWRKIVANSFEIKKYEPINSAYFKENDRKFNNLLQ